MGVILQLILEHLFVILPMCLCETKHIYPSIYIMIILCLICLPYLLFKNNTDEKNNNNNPKKIDERESKKIMNNYKPDYISWYRSLVLLYTIIAILAVDFHIFPRRFAKTE